MTETGKTIDERLAELKAKHDEEAANIERERGLFERLTALNLPLPDSVMHFKPAIWLGYKVGTRYSTLGQPAKIEDGLAVVAKFEDYIQDLAAVEDGCVSVKPMALQGEPRQRVDNNGNELPREHKIRWQLDHGVLFNQDGNENYMNCFWAAHVLIDGQPMMVRVVVEPAPYETVAQHVEREGNFEGARIVGRWVEPSWPYERQPDKHIRWAAGSERSWMITYYWDGIPTMVKKAKQS